MITVLHAPPFATVQDLGRTGYRDIGVPLSGVADRESALAINALLGNAANAAMIEWAVAGGALRFDSHTEIALGGADAECVIGAQHVSRWTRIQVAPGDVLEVRRIVSGRFLLVAARGGIDVPIVLGSRSTLLSAGFGGFEGRRLRNGDQLRIGAAFAPTRAENVEVQGASNAPFHVIAGPQAFLFDDAAWSQLLDTEFTVSRASDRAGYRLEGAVISHRGSASLPSEPACVGAIQVPHGGAPIVIMNDGPTVGGYPKIAVLRRSSISRFAQLAPGDRARFMLDTAT